MMKKITVVFIAFIVVFGVGCLHGCRGEEIVYHHVHSLHRGRLVSGGK